MLCGHALLSLFLLDCMAEYKKSTSFWALFFTFVPFFCNTKHWGGSFLHAFLEAGLGLWPSFLVQSSVMSSSREQSYKRSDMRGSPICLSFNHFPGRSREAACLAGSGNDVCSTRCWKKCQAENNPPNRYFTCCRNENTAQQTWLTCVQEIKLRS